MFLFIFTSCSPYTDIKKEPDIDTTAQIQSENTDIPAITKSNSNTNISESLSDDSNIEIVVLSIMNQENEYSYDEEINEFLSEIKSCKDTPEAMLIDKVGSISVILKDSDEKIEYAALYLASDNNVYAKYTSKEKNDYAYKIDIEKLNHK